MRLLFETVGTRRIELIDGLKVWEEHGWILVLPDRSEPQLDLWVYAQTVEHHNELRDKYLELVGQLAKKAAEAPLPTGRTSSIAPSGGPAGVSEDRSFHFWVPGRYLGVRARSLREFVDVLHYIEGLSISYHFERGDFANWLGHELKLVELARTIRSLKPANKEKETLRTELLQLLSKNETTEKQTASKLVPGEG